MKPIVVRIDRHQRTFIQILSWASLTLAAACALWEPRFGLLVLAASLPILILALWNARWCVTIDRHRLLHQRLFRAPSLHTNAQIADLRSVYADHADCLIITFSDGTRLKLRMDCENADRAKRFLISQHSIR